MSVNTLGFTQTESKNVDSLNAKIIETNILIVNDESLTVGAITLPAAAASQCSTPPINFLGDVDTGIGSQAANELDLVTGGACRVSVTNANTTFAHPIRLPTTGGTASDLNYYEEFTLVTTWSGPWAAAQSSNLDVVRSGKIVTLSPAAEIIIASANNLEITADTVLPARFLPDTVGVLNFTIQVQDNSVLTVGLFTVNSSSGVLKIFADITGAQFAATNNAGFFRWAVSYVSA